MNEVSTLTDELTRFKAESDRTLLLARENGVVVDTSEWLTIKRYAQRYDLSIQVVTNWIARGVIPADCTMTLPELNDIRLVKNQSYAKVES